MWDELAWSPVILSRTVIWPGGAVTVIVPLAVARTPFSLKVNAAGLGEADGVAEEGGVGEGDGAELVPDAPHAAHRARVAKATRPCLGFKVPPHRFRALPMQVTGATSCFSRLGPWFRPCQRGRGDRASPGRDFVSSSPCVVWLQALD